MPEDLSGKKVVIISDLHLGKKPNAVKLSQITKAVASCDKLIINGDLWEGFAYTMEEFLGFDWKSLFPLFKSKEAVYLYGNHDRDYRNNPQTSQFSVMAANQYEFVQNDTVFHVRHGDEFAPTLDMRLPRIAYFYWVYERAVALERFFIKNFGKPFLHVYRKDNEKMIAWKKSNLPEKDWLICGHSHLAMIDEGIRFANSGIFEPPVATYLSVENAKVTVLNGES